MTRLFLDTEWADLEGDHLVSLALVSEDGHHRFYAEVDPLPEQPTDFVRQVVYPLLERGHAAMPMRKLTEQLRAFIERFPQPRYVMHDYHHDAALMRRALTGQGFEWAGELGTEPAVDFCLIAQGDLLRLVEACFETNAEANARRHHAGVDAEVLRRAFRAAVYQDSLEGWS